MRVFLATGPKAGEKRSFVVDEEDAEFVGSRKWQADKAGYISALFVTRGAKRRFMLQRMLLGVTDAALQVDHRDGNPLNNTRGNLRLATPTQNLANRAPGKGVSRHHTGGWIARITGTDGKRYSRVFDAWEDAADWYDQEARRIHGEFAVNARND